MRKIVKSEEEISIGIDALYRQMNLLMAESTTREIKSHSVNVEALASGFRNTVRRIFGQESPEFAEFGQLEIFNSSVHNGASQGELTQAGLRGRDYMVSVTVELVRRLQQEDHERRIWEKGKVSNEFSGLALHPEIHAATNLLLADGHVWEAVFAASKALVLYVKKLSGRTDLDGVPLMRTVFSKNNPVLRFNDLSTQTALDEQEGMMHLYEGAVMALRNPGGHDFPSGSEKNALQYIQLLSLLAFRSDEATK